MDVILGIQNVANTVTFSTDEPSAQVVETINKAVSNNRPIILTDNKDRQIIVPSQSLAYAIVGSETRHAVGFGAIGTSN